MDVFIPIVFPDYKISAYGTRWEGLGHAGVLFILGSTGTTKYYEYGRYDKVAKGLVRKLTIPNAKIDKRTGKIELGSLSAVFHAISKQSGQGTRIVGAYIEHAHGYQKALDYVEAQKKGNTDPKRKEYSLLSHNCGTFMQHVLDAAGIDTPWMLDPRPISYIEDLRSEFPALDYDPRSDTVTILASESEQ